jgi:hypothetical protein
MAKKKLTEDDILEFDMEFYRLISNLFDVLELNTILFEMDSNLERYKFLLLLKEKFDELLLKDTFPFSDDYLSPNYHLELPQVNIFQNYCNYTLRYTDKRIILNAEIIQNFGKAVLNLIKYYRSKLPAKYLIEKIKYQDEIYEDYDIAEISKRFRSYSTYKERYDYLIERKILYLEIRRNDEKYRFVCGLEEDLLKHKESAFPDEFLSKQNSKLNSRTKNNSLEWNNIYSLAEFLELCKALVESKAIIGTQIAFIKAFSGILNIEIKNPEQQINETFKGRNNDNQIIFLHKLIEALNNMIAKRAKLKKNENNSN